MSNRTVLLNLITKRKAELAAGKFDGSDNLLGMMIEQAKMDVFTDEEILDEVIMFYVVCISLFTEFLRSYHNFKNVPLSFIL